MFKRIIINKYFCLGTILSLVTSTTFISCNSDNYKHLVFIGPYTDNGSEGIYSFQFNPEDGKTTQPILAAISDNPSFIAVDNEGKILYAVNEVDNYDKNSSGAISVYELVKGTGKLNLVQQVSSLGAHPAHLSIDKTGKYLLVANYTSGNIAVFPISKDGRLGEHTALIQNYGSSVNPERQTSPHAHFIQVSNDNKFVMVADLGIDKILIFQFDSTTGSLNPHEHAYINLSPGSGPRHLAFGPSGKFLYVLNELTSTITVFDFDPTTSSSQSKQTISTLRENFEGTNTAAEILVDAKGKFLYASNRGDNSIVQFSIDPVSGMLTSIAWTSSGGKAPRNFEIDPTGRWLFSANQNSDNILLFKIDQENGGLINTNQTINIKSPVCIKFTSLK